ncbi:MAG TPA: DUF4252 domain-containing protein [Candidatus Saccharimonadales bacterium]|jgi:hypothetical protein|nr:DUF4252 domain-containing protein [Candidatus Saccharimonadales bacterium]
MKLIPAITRGHMVLLAAVLALLSLPGQAQGARLELKNLEKLSSKATEVTDVTLDGDLLQMASKFASKSDDKDAHEASDLIKGLTGIYVKSFKFDKPSQYTQADVEGIRSQLAGPGWSRIVQSTSKHSGETNEIYLMKKDGKVMGVAILVAEPQELTVVNIAGAIDMDKLGELGGKFGVPETADHSKHNKKSGEAGHEKK